MNKRIKRWRRFYETEIRNCQMWSCVLFYVQKNADCNGCGSNGCPDNDSCENKKCSIAKELTHCYECEEQLQERSIEEIKPYTFTLFAKKIWEKKSSWIV